MLAVAGCQKAETKAAAPKPPEVVVAPPTEQDFREFEEFTGRITAIDTVELRSRVSGYLDKVLFKDGDNVKKDEQLFVIDQRPYQAEVNRTTAAVGQAKAHLARLESQFARAKKLIETKAIAQEEFDNVKFDRDESEASVKAAQASAELAQLNLTFTEIPSPVTGRISRRLVDPGNLIRADETPLAMLVSLDPVYAYFDVDERTVLRIRRMVEDGQLAMNEQRRVEVQLSLADKDDFSIRGVVDFEDNQLDPSTGTLRMRARVANPDLLLSSGMFVRCRYPIGQEQQGLFVPEEALGSDQGQTFLYVVNDRDEIEYRRVNIGPLVSGRRLVRDNLAAGERVVVTGLQRARPGIKVTPKTDEGKSLAASDGERAAAR